MKPGIIIMKLHLVVRLFTRINVEDRTPACRFAPTWKKYRNKDLRGFS